MPGDNLEMLQSCTLVDTNLKKKEQAISFHTIGESVVSGIINPINVGTEVNVAEFLTKALAWKEHHYHSGVFFSKWGFGSEQNMSNVKLRTLSVKGKRVSRSYSRAPEAKQRRW
jgi:hypothetical protein